MVSMSVHQFSDLLPKRLMDKFLQDQQLKGEAACYESRLLYVVPPDGLPREEVVTRVRSLVQPVLNFKWNVVYRDFHDLSLFYELREQHGVVEISFSDSEVRKVYFRSASEGWAQRVGYHYHGHAPRPRLFHSCRATWSSGLELRFPSA